MYVIMVTGAPGRQDAQRIARIGLKRGSGWTAWQQPLSGWRDMLNMLSTFTWIISREPTAALLLKCRATSRVPLAGGSLTRLTEDNRDASRGSSLRANKRIRPRSWASRGHTVSLGCGWSDQFFFLSLHTLHLVHTVTARRCAENPRRQTRCVRFRLDRLIG